MVLETELSVWRWNAAWMQEVVLRLNLQGGPEQLLGGLGNRLQVGQRSSG